MFNSSGRLMQSATKKEDNQKVRRAQENIAVID